MEPVKRRRLCIVLIVIVGAGAMLACYRGVTWAKDPRHAAWGHLHRTVGTPATLTLIGAAAALCAFTRPKP